MLYSQTTSKAVFWRMKQVVSVQALEAVLAAAQRPPSNEDSRVDARRHSAFQAKLRYQPAADEIHSDRQQ